MKPLSYLLACTLALILLAQPVAAQGQMPETMAYQGYLTNTDGDPANGTTTVVFRLYDQSSGGTTLWEETHQDVLFTDGVFSAHLGSVRGLREVSFGGPLWLGVSVAGGQELAPRVALETVPYAMSVRGLRVIPGAGANGTPNLIGGDPDNRVEDNIDGATIGGGGGLGEDRNQIIDLGIYATIGGGRANQVSAQYATIGGGALNNAAGDNATIGGGVKNEAEGDQATVGGGQDNQASAEKATVAGGANNTASGERATISGGENNTAGRYATVGGGQVNRATGFSATVAGGTSNEALGEYATVAGGQGNEASGEDAVVGGGRDNRATGLLAMVPGGFQSHATGFVSFAAGYNARAVHDGAFVWTDAAGIPVPFSSTAPDQFLIRAAGGVGIGTDAPQGALHVTETTLGINSSGFSNDALVVEGNQPVIGVYGSFQANTRPGLVLAGVDGGNVVDKWGIVREFFSGNALHFTYGLNDDHTQNPSLMTLSNATGRSSLSVPDGIVSSGQLRATRSLGASATPFQGSVYQDNMVYAWAHVQSNGTVTASYGCTVSKITGTGSYRVTFKRQLPNGASAIVTPQGVNDPVIATVSVNGTQAQVATKVFNGSAFVAFDSGFYIQVVGRP